MGEQSSHWHLTPTRLIHGVWEGVLNGPQPAQGAAPRLDARLDGTSIACPELSPEGKGQWRVLLAVPSEAISDGMQVVTLHLVDTDEVLGQFAVLAGDVLRQDLRAEVELLRAELDLLKRMVRRQSR